MFNKFVIVTGFIVAVFMALSACYNVYTGNIGFAVVDAIAVFLCASMLWVMEDKRD